MLKNAILLLLLLLPLLVQAAPSKGDSLLKVLKQRTDAGLEDSTTVDLYILLVDEYLTHDQDKAFEYTRKAMKMAEKLQNRNKAAIINSHLGNIFRNRGLYDLSLEAYINASRIHESLNNKEGLSFCDNDIGNIYFQQGDTNIALNYYHRALNHGRQSGKLLPEIVSLNNAALIYRAKGMLDSSRFFVQQALAISKRSGAPRQIILDYLYLGTIHRKKGETQQALTYYDSALALTGQLPDRIDVERAKINMMKGQVLTDAGKYASALKLLAIAEDLYLKSGHQDILELYRFTCQAWIGYKNYKKAEEYAMKELQRAKADDLLPHMHEAYKLLTTIYEKMGNPAKALECYKEAVRIHDIIFSDASSKKIATLHTAYQIHQKERELEKARQANIIQKHALRSQQARNAALLVISIMGLALAGAIAVAYRIARRRSMQLLAKNHIIEQQKEEIAKNLTELENAKKLAEAHSNAKSQFLSNMSHEIRTPMNAIVGFTDLMLEGNQDEETRQHLHSVHYAATNLAVIINDILDMSKIEAGELRLERIPFRPHVIVEELVLICKASWSRKAVSLTYSIEENVPKLLLGDPTRLHQILLNLVNNAMKFTGQGKVHLRVSAQPSAGTKAQLRFEVSDTGIGIPEDKISEIFESFKQGGHDTSRKYGGTGLGLAICKKLAEMQNGSINVNSRPGEGSVFTVEIPFTLSKETIPAPEPAPKATANVAESTLPAGLQILCVEDNQLNQTLIRRIFSKWDVQVTIASDGREAIERYNETKADLVLMDIQMPEMNGYETTRHIRQMEADSGSGQNVPIIGLTADVFQESQDKALVAGMNAVVTKPFRQAELLNTIRKVLSRGHEIAGN